MSDYQLEFPTFEDEQKTLDLRPSEMVFVVGANGTGKSSLMQRFATQNPARCRWLTAHRQVWFNSNTMDITPLAREQGENNIRSYDQSAQSRWMDQYAAQRSQITIFDLVDSENVDARKIAAASRARQAEEVERLIKTPAPITVMNSILRTANLNIKINVDSGSKVMANRDESKPYSIAELSDGERNAILIIANVLTAPDGTLIILDEPERHLHRSIVSPLLTTLLTERNDCAFIVSTHDISLLLDQKNAAALLIREYHHQPPRWDADYVDTIGEIDETIVGAILGARRKILFVEGSATSLDRQIYQILYPNVSVVPAGSCIEVERAVKGIRTTTQHHRVLAFGLIDRDFRSDPDIAKLETSGVIALEQHSVESLYYHPITMKRMAKRAQQLFSTVVDLEQVKEQAITDITKNVDRLVARIAERRIRDTLLNLAPSWKNLLHEYKNQEINLNPSNFIDEEKQQITKLLNNRDLASLINRYPLRESPVLAGIAEALGLQTREKYEASVRKMLIEDEEAQSEMRSVLKPLTSKLNH